MAHDCDRGPDRSKPASHSRICKSCSKILATTSPDGDLVPAFTQDQACDVCRRFEELYTELQVSDEAFLALEGRRDNHVPRWYALEASKTAHRTFDNFMMLVEAQSGNALPEPASVSINAPPEPEADSTCAPQQGQKRPLTPSSPPQSVAKRLRPTLESKRHVSFDAAVVFRDKEDSRPDDYFCRSSGTYRPGRNAAPKGVEYMDTGGSASTPTRFFGLRKRGNGWVQTKEGKEMDERWQSDASGEGDGMDMNAGEQQGVGEEPKLGGGSDVGSLLNNDTHPEALEREQSPTKDMASQSESPSSKSSTSTTSTATNSSKADDSFDYVSKFNSASPEKDEKLFTYGGGWVEKTSPESRPTGDFWNHDTATSLSDNEFRENLYRGRNPFVRKPTNEE
jgi:hypothetical protein